MRSTQSVLQKKNCEENQNKYEGQVSLKTVLIKKYEAICLFQLFFVFRLKMLFVYKAFLRYVDRNFNVMLR